MIISDIRCEFYDFVLSKHVLVLVNFDVDAVCACKILLSLFHYENVLYTLVPITGKSDLVQAVHDYKEQIDVVVCINCGASVNLAELLQPPEHIVIYVLDNHRPVDVFNIYNSDQIRIVMNIKSEDNIPNFDDIFNDENESEDFDDSEDFTAEERILKRQEKRFWEENRTKILFDYTQFSYYDGSTAVSLFELSWKLSKDSIELVWCAIVGLTELYFLEKIESETYLVESANLQNHVSRLSSLQLGPNAQNGSHEGQAVTFDTDLQLTHYRHWSLLESFYHSHYTSCKFKLWTLKGHKKLCEFLAEMGLPLAQCQQKYHSMDRSLKCELFSLIEGKVNKYDLGNIMYGSFTGHYGFRHKYAASDIVNCILATLESEEDKSASLKFLGGLDCLSRHSLDAISQGIELSKRQLKLIFSEVQTLLDTHQVISAGTCLIVNIPEGSVGAKHFGKPNCLLALSRFLLRAYVASSRSKRAHTLPLIITAPLHSVENTLLVLGLPPLAETSSRNLLGKAFEKSGESTSCIMTQDYFDSFMLQLRSQDRTKFIDALISLLSL